MYKSRRRDEPKTTFVRDMIVIVFILCLLTLVALQFHNVMSWCGPPSMPHEYIMDVWEEMTPGECTGPIFSSLSSGILDMDGCPPEHNPSFIHTKMEKFNPFDPNSDRQITSETVWTRCKLGLDGQQENIHVQNILDEDVLRKAAARGPNAAVGGPNELLSVTVLLISSLSGQHFSRMMKETSTYLSTLGMSKNDVFEAFHFTRYNVVGGDTLSNQLPIFSMPSSRKAEKGKENREREKWVWEHYHNLGYVNYLAGEDCVYENSIKSMVPRHSNNEALIDVEFDDVYCDESMNNPRVIGKVWKHGASCIGNQYVHRILLSYTEDFLDNYIAVPRFTTAIFQTANEPTQTRVKTLDRDLFDFIQLLTSSSSSSSSSSRFNINPNSTNLGIIILMSEQGEGEGTYYKATKSGFIEHRRPLLYVLAPKAWLTKYPHVRYNLQQNRDKLVVGQDIYQTLQDIPLLPFHSHTPYESHATPRNDLSSYSLFDSIPADRECEMANIPNKFCTCETTYSFIALILILPALLLFWWLYTWCAKLNIKRTVYVNNLQLR